MTTIQHAAACAAIVLSAASTAPAQDSRAERDRGRSGGAIEAAKGTLGLDNEQIDKIREIQRARPPRGQDREGLQAWRDEQRSKTLAVLSAEQKDKLDELNAERERLAALAGAAILGLAETDRAAMPGPFQRGFGADRSRSGPGRGWGQRGPGRGRSSFGGRRGSFGRGRGWSPQNRGFRGADRR